MKKTACALIICFAVLATGSVDAKKKTIVKAIGGTIIPGFGLVIDASYDPKLDTFAPGYRMLNVAIVNTSFNIVAMDPQRDGWWIKTKDEKKKYKLVGDLRSEDPEVWRNLPDKAKNLISYPLLLPIGAQQAIDLFVPKNVPVEDFREIIVYINSLDATFEVLARE